MTSRFGPRPLRAHFGLLAPILLLFAFPAGAQRATNDPVALIAKMEGLYRSAASFQGTITTRRSGKDPRRQGVFLHRNAGCALQGAESHFRQSTVYRNRRSGADESAVGAVCRRRQIALRLSAVCERVRAAARLAPHRADPDCGPLPD